MVVGAYAGGHDLLLSNPVPIYARVFSVTVWNSLLYVNFKN